MATKELITLQFGDDANYTAAHFWNLQVRHAAVIAFDAKAPPTRLPSVPSVMSQDEALGLSGERVGEDDVDFLVDFRAKEERVRLDGACIKEQNATALGKSSELGSALAEANDLHAQNTGGGSIRQSGRCVAAACDCAAHTQHGESLSSGRGRRRGAGRQQERSATDSLHLGRRRRSASSAGGPCQRLLPAARG